MRPSSSEDARSIVFIDDSHTFGGAQIALAWAVRAILQNTEFPVVCVCTGRTQAAVTEIAGEHGRLSFRRCPAVLPLNLLTFPLRLVPMFRILHGLQRQGVRAWWLNLSGLEFCLAPLAVLKLLGQRHSSWLHCTEAMSVLVPSPNAGKQLINRVRDLVASRFVLWWHPVLASPSKAASAILTHRSRTNHVFAHLYPTMSQLPEPASSGKARRNRTSEQVLWSIGRVQFGQKNNKAAVEAAYLLTQDGLPVSLKIVGDGPDLAALQQYTQDLPLPTDVEFYGWKANPWSGVEADDIILLPSRWEGMPLVAIEAMLRGCRIVTSPLPMFHEGVPSEFIAADLSGAAVAAQVEKVRGMTRQHVEHLLSRELAKFSAECFLHGFWALTNQASSVKYLDGSLVPAQRAD